MHVDYVHILLDLLLDIALFINVSSNSIFSYPQIPLVYFLLCLRVELLLLILYSAHVEPSPASIFLSFQVSYKDNHITYEHSFLSFFLVWILLILLLCCLGLPDNWVTSAEGDSLALFLTLERKL